MKNIAVSVLLIAALLVTFGCAKTSTTTPPPPTNAVQFVAYAEAAVAAAQTAIALIPSLSPSDQQLAQIALSDVGTGLTCVYNEAVSSDSTVVKVGKITACLQGLTVPPQASPQVQAILAGVFNTVQAFVAAFEQQSAAQQAATVAAITPSAALPVTQKAAALVKK